jgi:hypothetical protein
MSMRSFREGLESFIGKDCPTRPLVCAGSPYDCQAFIVGINAATSCVPFRDFWNDERGFDERNWYSS